MKKGIVLFTIALMSSQSFAASFVCHYKFDQDASITISNDKETGFMAEVDTNLSDEVDGETLTEKKSLQMNFQGETLTSVKLMSKSPLSLNFQNMTISQNNKSVDLECVNSSDPAQELASILGEDSQGFIYSKAIDKNNLKTAYVKDQSFFEGEANRAPASK